MTLRRALLASVLAVVAVGPAATATAATLPPNFQETTVFSGLSNPTTMRFASDGRVFVAEKSGRIRTFDSLNDATPSTTIDLSTNTYNFWDRGMLGLAIDPNWPTERYIYVLYTYDADIGGLAPKWGTPGVLSDPCPSQFGATADGCVVSGRLSRIPLGTNGVANGPEDVLIEDWCQQYPSHSIGQLAFGSDGALYVSGGDGASFNFTDWGQDGNPVNPCGDPPGPPGTALTPPTAQGGALRSQDLRTSGDPTTLDGTVLRVDKTTGDAFPGNPLGFSSDANARRIVAHGLRNPFRLAVRPGTNDVWVGDVGWNNWEEVNHLGPVADLTVDNFGWPCYEGTGRQSGYDGANLNICENLYGAGPSAHRQPHYTYSHSAVVVNGESCPTGGSSISGLSFYDGGNYPATYLGALFFADYSRDCIWAMLPGGTGLPDPNNRQTFVAAASNPVDVQTGPNGDVFYADFDGGTIRRIRFLGSNNAPVAVATATPTSGAVPLNVNFNGTASSDADGQPLTYSWDLNGDGTFGDATIAQPSFTYMVAGSYTVRLRVTDSLGASDTDQLTINANASTPPNATILSPTSSLNWKVGDTVNFSGQASDPEDGTLPGSALSWSLILHHCPSTCHTHPIQDFVNTVGGSFQAPDHEYPSYLELRLTATDSSGVSDTESVLLQPQTVNLTFETVPQGLQIAVGGTQGPTPFTRTVIAGSVNTISGISPQASISRTYAFASWSDGGAQTHAIVAPPTSATYTATYTDTGPAPPEGLVAAYAFEEGTGAATADASGNTNTGTLEGGTAWTPAGKYGGALFFDGVNDAVRVEDSASLDLTAGMTLSAWVRPQSLVKWKSVIMKEQPTSLSYALYANSNTNIPVTEAFIGGAVRRASGGGQIPLDAWTHLAGTYDGTVIRMYVNGVLVGQTTRAGGITTSNNPLRIGGNAIWPEWFHGLIDDVRVYQRALAATEIQSDMNTPTIPPPPSDTEPPTAPTNVVANGTFGQVQLTWTAATDNIGVTRYNVHRSTVGNFLPNQENRIAQVAGTSHLDAPLAPGVYFYKVVAEDGAGLQGPPSNVASGTVPADSEAPTTPGNPAAVVTGSDVALSWTASTDNVGVTRYNVHRSTTQGFTPGPGNRIAQPTGASYTDSALNPGTYYYVVTAQDAALNVSGATAEVAATVESPPPPPPPPPSLVAAYSFDEGAGTTANDLSGNGNAGTINGPTWTVGRFGQGLQFDGVNDIVTAADSNSLDLTTGMTLEAWVKPTAAGSAWRTALFKQRTGNMVYSLYSKRNTDLPLGEITVGTTTVRAATGTSGLAQNAWSHLALTYDGTNLRLFVNGAQVALTVTAGNIATSTGALTIGGNAIWGEWFQGVIDEIRIHNRALTEAELLADMNTSVGIPDTEPPTAPTNFVKTGSTAASISTSWTASTDNVGVGGYRLFRGTTEVGTTTGTTFTFVGLACGTAHNLAVEAFDFSNRVSTPRTTLTASTSDCDLTPPSVSVTDPASGATVSGTTVNVAATVSDNDAVAGVQFLVDGQPLGSEDTTAPYSVTWNTWGHANGAHTVTARARDASNNLQTSADVPVTVSNTGSPPSPGLVASYGFDEGSGNAAADSTGNGNNGTVNGPAWTIGRFGQALSFDGVNDRVSVPDSNTLDLTTGMTLEAWVKPTVLGTAWKTVMFKHRNSNATNMVYVMYGNRNTSVPNGEITVGTSVKAANGTSQLPLNVWSHLAVTYDGTELRLFVNGNQVASLATTGSIATSTGDLWIGGNNVWAEWFSGAIDEVRVYNRALTAADIQADMNRAAAPDADPPGIVATTPADGATNVGIGSSLTATFDEAMNPATITSSTFELRDSANALVPAGVTYDALAGRATLTPSAPLAFDSTYTATVKSGASGVKDLAGNPLAADRTWSFVTVPPPPPIAVFSSSANKFGAYAVEVLKAEGLNAVDNVDVASLNAAALSGRDVVVLGEAPLTAAQVTALTNWVNAGGNLIALRPDKQLAGLLGLTDQAATLANAYMKIDTTPGAPGAGLTGLTMQFHGTADRYALNGATAIATLYSNSTTATANPAVTLRSVGGSGGQAAAFTYDLARSIVYTRQGNPSWAGQNRDGIGPPRPNDLFFGAMVGDPQPDWLDTQKIGIPQADEQQRLLANLILRMNRDRTPLPRFWYFPRDEKAVVIMTGDDHAEGGTAGRFDQHKAQSQPGCSVLDWECVRGTSYVYANSPLTNAQAAAYEADGFEVSLHVNTGCTINSPAQINADYVAQLADFAARYTSVPAPRTNRTHCVAWSDWSTEPKTELSHGIRLDTNYYHYPASWIGMLPGYMNGTGLIMRFADLDGTTINTWQSHTHMNDEANQAYPATSDFLLDNALGPNAYYGFFTTNMHTDFAVHPGSDAIVASAQARGVPIITAKQALDWMDGRDTSTLTSFNWASNTLGFTLRPGTGARGLRAMLPTSTATSSLTGITKEGSPVAYTTQTIKGVEYAIFEAQNARYAATYTP